ncbi:MAG: BLUF domain-containing protein [Ottowia sp.]|nr:BLUF domain-containing protein [Ottowia sp.]
MLVRLLYASRTVDAPERTVAQILAAARDKNLRRGVTGVLVCGGPAFLHVLEGNRRAVSDLYGQIQRDPRHTEVELLSLQDIGERRFGAWALGVVNVAQVNPSVLLKYSEVPELDPYSVPGATSLALIEDLVATAAITCHA